jgi:hypothetical protein
MHLAIFPSRQPPTISTDQANFWRDDGITLNSQTRLQKTQPHPEACDGNVRGRESERLPIRGTDGRQVFPHAPMAM